MDIVRDLKIKKKNKKKELMDEVFEQHRIYDGQKNPLFYLLGLIILVYGFLNIMYFSMSYSNLFIEDIVVMEYFSKIILINEIRNGLIFAFLLEIVGGIILWKY